MRAEPANQPGTRRTARSLVPVLAAVPFLVLAVQARGYSVSLGSDPALVELGVRDALHLHQLVGVYSRFGWHHPGPAWLALLAPTYRLLGSTSAALIASVAVLNAAFSALIAAAVQQLFGTRRSLLAVGAVLGLALALGIGLFRVAWNPYAVVLPTVLFLVCAWGALLGQKRYAWMTALVGSIIVQTHIGLLPLVATVLALVVGHRARRFSRPASGWLLVIAVWLPSLWDEGVGSGNLTTLLRFFLRPHAPAGWRVAFGRIDELLTRAFLSWAPGRLDLPLDGTGGWLLTALVLVCGSLVVLGAQRHDLAVRVAGELGLAGFLAAVLGAHAIVGTADPYLLLWACALPVPLVLAGAPVIFSRWARAARPVAVAVAVGACAACVAADVSLSSASGLGDPAVARIDTSVRSALPRAPRTVLVTVGNHDAWPLSTGLALALTRQGYRVVVPDAWVFMFGDQYRVRCQPGLEVRITGTTAAGGARGSSAVPAATAPPPAAAEVRSRGGGCR